MSNPHVLIIDDDEENYGALVRTISKTGYETTYARDGAEGIDLAAKLNPGVIILDLHMPGVDGLEFLRRASSLDLQASVVVSSGTTQMDDVVQVLRRGVVDFVRKPWFPADIRNAVARAFQIHASRHSAGPSSVFSRQTHSDLLARIHQGAMALPPVPLVLEHLRGIASRKDTTLDVVAKLVSRDDRLAARILELGNSPSGSRPRVDLTSAIVRIGFDAVHALAEVVWLQQCFPCKDVRFGKYLERMGRFAHARAVAARALAGPARLAGSAAYLAGLFADVGAMYLLHLVGEVVEQPPSPEECLPFIREYQEVVSERLLITTASFGRVDRHARLLTLASYTAASILGEPHPIAAPLSTADADRCARELDIDPATRTQRTAAAAQEFHLANQRR